jgi:hypothetical protein
MLVDSLEWEGEGERARFVTTGTAGTDSSRSSTEIISISVGQAGVQIGNAYV